MGVAYRKKAGKIADYLFRGFPECFFASDKRLAKAQAFFRISASV